MGLRKLLLVMLLAAIAHSLTNATQAANHSTSLGPEVNWVVESNPSKGEDYARSICFSHNYIYIVGSDSSPGDRQWRIEMREKTTGRLVKIWTQNPSKDDDELRDCVVVGNRLYVVGYDEVPGNGEWAILMFDLNLTLLKIERSNPSDGWDRPNRVATDGKYLYIAGTDANYRREEKTSRGVTIIQEWRWRVEKRDLNLSLVKVYSAYGGSVDLEGIGVNPVTNQIWLAGYIEVERRDRRILVRPTLEILDKEHLKVLKNSTLDVFPILGLFFDYEGNGYIYGRSITKINKDGITLTVQPTIGLAGVFAGGKVYLLELKFDKYINAYFNTRDTIYLMPLNNSLVAFVNVSDVELTWKAVFDGRNVYIAGSVERMDDFRWVVASISVPVSVRVVALDGFGNARDWPVEVLNSSGGVVASGRGGVTVELLSGRDYVARVRALGVEIERKFAASEGLVVEVAVPTARIAARAVDGFGKNRAWPVEIAGVGRGDGTVGPVEVLGNRTYVVMVYALGRMFNRTIYVAPGSVYNISVVVPTVLLSARVVDGFGRVRAWPVELVGLASGTGAVGPVEVIAGVYTARAAAFGAVFNKTVEVKAGQNVTITVEIPTAMLSAKVIDGFGSVRDWPVVVLGVASGAGHVGPVEVLGGRRYVVVATAFNKNFTETATLAPGDNKTLVVKVPTAKVVAKAVDGFGKTREWPVEIVGVTSGKGEVGPVEVLAGQYVARVVAFGREFNRSFTAEMGRDVVFAVEVPTAVINITVLDDERKPIDRYVEYVAVNGETYPKPPKGVEVLAGEYYVRIRALGKEVADKVVVRPGEVKNVELVVPGTAGFDIGGVRVTYTTTGVLLAVAVAAALAVYVLRRRK